MKKDTCKSCRFWQLHYNEGYGDCRRRSPIIAEIKNHNSTPELRAVALWPHTPESEWCGDFSAAHPNENTLSQTEERGTSDDETARNAEPA